MEYGKTSGTSLGVCRKNDPMRMFVAFELWQREETGGAGGRLSCSSRATPGLFFLMTRGNRRLGRIFPLPLLDRSSFSVTDIFPAVT